MFLNICRVFDKFLNRGFIFKLKGEFSVQCEMFSLHFNKQLCSNGKPLAQSNFIQKLLNDLSSFHVGLSWSARHLWPMILKETPNSFKKWPLYLWWISNKTIMVVGNATKAATFLHQSYKKHTIILFVTVLFNIFMRQIY